MKDFIQTNYNKDISTEDFKAIVGKHILKKWISPATGAWIGFSMNGSTAPKCQAIASSTR